MMQSRNGGRKPTVQRQGAVSVADEATARSGNMKPERDIIGFYWRWHDSNQNRRRVWRWDWSGDQFEILNEDDFAVLQDVAHMFGFPVREAEDD